MIFLILFLILFLSIIFLAFNVLPMAKNNNTYKNHKIIIDAIHLYLIYSIHNGERIEVTYDDMEDYDTTFRCVTDWGYKHILPNDKFKIIEPYIKY